MTSVNRMMQFKRMVELLAVGGKLLTTQEKLAPRFYIEQNLIQLENKGPMVRLVLRHSAKNVPQ